MSAAGRSLQATVLTAILLVSGLLPAATIAEAAQQAAPAGSTATATATITAPSTTGHVQAARAQPDQLVFSMGELAAVDARTVTLMFADGQAETYRLAPETTIQTQNGDAQTVSDLDVGVMVVVIAREDDPTALTIVNGGDTGFHEAGPADIRGHQNECGAAGPRASSEQPAGASAQHTC